jgi:hypothetical protein
MDQDEKNNDYLSKAGKKLPYTVPEDYFDRFAERLQNRMKQEKQLPFTVPEGYFEQFAQRLQKRMQQEVKPSWMERTYQLIRPQLAMAAVIIGYVAISYTGIRIFLNNRTTEPTLTEIANVLDDYVYEMDDELLISTIIEEEIEVDWINGGYEPDDIMDYLMEEETDYSNLINEYTIY